MVTATSIMGAAIFQFQLRLEKFESFHAQRDCNLLHVIKGDVAYLTFNMRDEGPVKVSFECQRLLRPISFCSQPY